MNVGFAMFLSLIVGYVLGIIYVLYKFRTIHGVIVVDDENESYFFKLSSDEIKNTKNSYITFKIEHRKDSQK